MALVGISIGTLHQKRRCAHIDLRTGAVVQFTVCALVFAPLALWAETRAVQWTPSFLFALGWSVLVLSVGAISVLYWLLRHGAAADVARLFYLVPPVTALQAWLLFGETLDAFALLGMVLIAVGVALARPATRAPPADGYAELAAARGATGCATMRVPASRSCRNCRSGSTNAHRKLNATSQTACAPRPYGRSAP